MRSDSSRPLWTPSASLQTSPRKSHLFRKIVSAGFVAYLLGSILAGIVIADLSLKLHRLPLRHQQAIASTVRNDFQAELQDVSINASDGAVLRGWYVHPSIYNGNAVVLLHGITDNREGVAGYGHLLLEHGYAVLLPDARRHGESGGELATYGVKEADDIHRWVSWIYQHDAPQCVYGFGESYGAALMLQSLAVENRFCAVAVESTFSTAREMSFERVSGPLHLQSWFGRTLGRPAIWSAMVYARVRYGVDLLQPSPLEAVKGSKVPVLLIHGDADQEYRSAAFSADRQCCARSCSTLAGASCRPYHGVGRRAPGV